MSQYFSSSKKFPHADPSQKFGIVVSDFNEEYTDQLLENAKKGFKKCSVDSKNIKTLHVPGAFELPLFSKKLIQSDKTISSILVLGVVIRGETSHYDHVCNTCANGVLQVSLETNIPILFGVITAENEQQVRKRLFRAEENAIAAVRLGG